MLSLTLKMVLDFTTRNQTNQTQIEAWFNPVEGWTAAKVNALVASYPGTATLLTTSYHLEVTDRGASSAGPDDREWQAYPGRPSTFDVDDPAAFELHLDAYMNDLQTVIEAFLTSQGVINRIVVLRWHIHMSAGSLDVVV